MTVEPRVPAPPPARPLGGDECDARFAALLDYRALVIAVSGGPDSLALMHLIAQWRKRHESDAPGVLVATVDHGLRAESRAEAEAVAFAAAQLGLPHTILTWQGEKPTTGIQDAARSARYRLLIERAAAMNAIPAAIVTAHTEDDQAETVLMRLARGSGVEGLAAMRPRRVLARDIVLERPLLDISKARLAATCHALRLNAVDDPSNSDPRFERVRWRAAMPGLDALGLNARSLALSAQRLARANEALDQATSDATAAIVECNGGAYARLEGKSFAALPHEIRVRLLGRLLTAYGGMAAPAELSQIEGLALRLSSVRQTKETLGGTLIRACEKQIRVFREAGRGLSQVLEIRAGDNVIWDRRFRIEAGAIEQPLIVRGLGATPYAALRHRLAKGHVVPARAAAMLPSFWSGSELVAVPGLSLVGPPPDGLSAQFLYDRSLKVPGNPG